MSVKVNKNRKKRKGKKETEVSEQKIECLRKSRTSSDQITTMRDNVRNKVKNIISRSLTEKITIYNEIT